MFRLTEQHSFEPTITTTGRVKATVIVTLTRTPDANYNSVVLRQY